MNFYSCLVTIVLILLVAHFVQSYFDRITDRPGKPAAPKAVNYSAPRKDWSAYRCPACGEPGTAFTRCTYPGCFDGRDA